MFTVLTWNVENLYTPEPSDRADPDAELDVPAGIVTASAAASPRRAWGHGAASVLDVPSMGSALQWTADEGSLLARDSERRASR